MDGVEAFLSRIGLSEYVEMFKAKGFDCEDDIPNLQGDDLDNMYIDNVNDRAKILQAALHYQPSTEYVLYEWLRSKGLEHYFVSFVQSELIDLVDVGHLNLPDEQLYDELEITLPGHKRRLERAVHSLRKKQKSQLPSFVTSGQLPLFVASGQCLQSAKHNAVPPSTTSESELPVAYGRWGKPRCLADAKYDFLMLDATVISTNNSSDRVHIEFMVDSGSDVVTLRQEVLDTMDLELIGPINSKGVHGSKVKNLYKAYILVGNQYVEIEVMGESYDSIGSRVMRHFRHYINGSHHIWLKGDFIDPTMPFIEKPFMSEKLNSAKAESLKVTDEIESADKVINSVDTLDDNNTAENELTDSLVQKDSLPHPLKVQKMITSLPDIVDSNTSSAVKVSVENGVGDSGHDGNEAQVDDTDETDRISYAGGEIIDIRPIIAANRKRHASNSVGLDPTKVNGNLAKRNKQSIQNDDACIDMVNHCDLIGGVKVAADKCETLRVVLNQRTVYYRSLAEEENIC